MTSTSDSHHSLRGLGAAAALAGTLIVGPASAAAANDASTDRSAGDNAAPHLAVSESDFDKTPNGQQIARYHLTNRNGMAVDIITFGARIQSITVPDENGKQADVALGFDNVKDYIDNQSVYFGAIIGRYGNRIAGGTFKLDGKTYNLPKNNGPNTLHGGTQGFDQKVWAASPIDTGNAVGVELTHFSPDGTMGFPGNLAVTVRYTLDNNNDLRIRYSAVSDKDTVINLTNHVYFNLAGAGSGDVLDQVAMINADQFTPIDKTLIPTGKLKPVKGTPLDFITPTPIGKNIHADNQQLKYAEPKQGGYDFNWVLNTKGNIDDLAARVTDPKSGRTVEMYTDQPGVQFYTSNFLDGSLKGAHGNTLGHWGGFTLEAQHYPDSPNQPDFPSTTLKAGEKYTQTTVYRFLPE
ncbi:aldose epimerase family protein [Salinisphaera sp. Q1T1-3]|uniref:aldose epimerase family protein n=1 Tax=Salinisphaera sp. Q1T1-3 TaxID=2321229 RepID=UPI000E715C2C|nr:aldose epimerase family protein [Salinisphaera sp. Q1T1-3]RJS93020.1 galactose mutarotase [Salinisphaera sp. Q1T1-3]